MKIIIETIPHNEQRYDTAGDWVFDADGTLTIKVSDMGNDTYSFLIGMHEAVEAWLCKIREIDETKVSNFDKEFRMKSLPGEPGDSPLAPYRKEHFFATNVERMLATELNVDWQSYDSQVENLEYQTKARWESTNE
jgi:hypothetical protein